MILPIQKSHSPHPSLTWHPSQKTLLYSLPYASLKPNRITPSEAKHLHTVSLQCRKLNSSAEEGYGENKYTESEFISTYLFTHMHPWMSTHNLFLPRLTVFILTICLLDEIPAKYVTTFLRGSLCDGVTSKLNCSSAVPTKPPTIFAGAEVTVAHLAYLHQPFCFYLLKSGTPFRKSA